MKSKNKKNKEKKIIKKVKNKVEIIDTLNYDFYKYGTVWEDICSFLSANVGEVVSNDNVRKALNFPLNPKKIIIPMYLYRLNRINYIDRVGWGKYKVLRNINLGIHQTDKIYEESCRNFGK